MIGEKKEKKEGKGGVNLKEIYALIKILSAFIAITIMVCSYFGKEKTVKFTKSDIEAITKIYEDYGDDVTVWKDKKGDIVVNIGH